MQRKEFKFSPLTFANIIIIVFLVGAIVSPFTGTCSNTADFKINADGKNPLETDSSVAKTLEVQKAFRKIYKEVNPAVVRIETESIVKMRHPFFSDPHLRRHFGIPDQQRRQGLGSGFVISKDGYIVTNQHVVNRVDKITVKFSNGKSANAQIIGSDPTSDLALLKVEGTGKLQLHAVYLGDSDKTEVGDFAIAIGNPFGLSSTFTSGVISSKGQDVESKDGVPRIQTDAPINPGNSGGPLLNIKGEVIGINQMIFSQSGGSNGIGFAIPINYAKEIIQKLKTGKSIKPGYIGIKLIPNPTDRQLEELNIKGKVGLLVGNVSLGSPAFKAGMRAYDFITHIEGKPANNFSQLKSLVVQKGAGKTITLKFIRLKELKTVKIKIGEYRES